MDAEDNEDVITDGGGLDVVTVVAVVLMIGVLGRRRRAPIPQHVSILTGQLYYTEVMESPNRNKFRVVARMDKATLTSLLDLLMVDGALQASQMICAGQKLMIFISALTGLSNRLVAERWQHSGSTISLITHEVAESFKLCRELLFQRPKITDPTPWEISSNLRRFPFFSDCIGALDGTMIPAIVPLNESELFRNRKRVIAQNVLAVANFDLTFSYALTGWEGSAHDGKVLADAKTKGLIIYPGKYYLGDAGYALSSTCLTPYRGVRYHLKEIGRAGEVPRNMKELFNMRHSSLRNVIERIFGVCKRRFPLLVKMNSFEFTFQCTLVNCAFMIHNFIHLNQKYEDVFYIIDENRPEDADEEDEVEAVPEVIANALNQ